MKEADLGGRTVLSGAENARHRIAALAALAGAHAGAGGGLNLVRTRLSDFGYRPNFTGCDFLTAAHNRLVGRREDLWARLEQRIEERASSQFATELPTNRTGRKRGRIFARTA
jgi:hypothetical protein